MLVVNKIRRLLMRQNEAHGWLQMLLAMLEVQSEMECDVWWMIATIEMIWEREVVDSRWRVRSISTFSIPFPVWWTGRKAGSRHSFPFSVPHLIRLEELN
jgi:hypothetical protein